MNMNFGDIIGLVQAIAWPVVAVVVALLFYRHLPDLMKALGSRISGLSFGVVSLEFVTAHELKPEILHIPGNPLEYLSEGSSSGGTSEHIPSLLEMAEKSPPADYLVIDLRDGKAWLTSRLYLFAVVLPPVLGLRCFVFVGTRDQVPRYFLGFASPESVARSLERRYSWLHKATVGAQLKDLSQGSDGDRWNREQVDAFNKLVRSMVSPIDLSQNNQSEVFVTRFLMNPEVRRPRDVTSSEEGWVQVSRRPRYENPDHEYEEKAQLIKDERDLLDLIGKDLYREQVTYNEALKDEALKDEVLRKQGSFVALTDAEGRFNRLINRGALLEALATGKYK